MQEIVMIYHKQTYTKHGIGGCKVLIPKTDHAVHYLPYFFHLMSTENQSPKGGYSGGFSWDFPHVSINHRTKGGDNPFRGPPISNQG